MRKILLALQQKTLLQQRGKLVTKKVELQQFNKFFDRWQQV